MYENFSYSVQPADTLMEECTMNKQGYYHNPPATQRTKTVTHPCDLLRLIWFAFVIYFDFNFDHEQMGLPPPLIVSQFRCDFFSPYHTRTEYIHATDEDHSHTQTQTRQNKSTDTLTFSKRPDIIVICFSKCVCLWGGGFKE